MYNLFNGYLKWLQEKSVKEIDSTKLSDFINMHDEKGVVEWSDILEKFEYEETPPLSWLKKDKTKVKKHFYRGSCYLRNVKRYKEIFIGELVSNKTEEIRTVEISVKDIDLFEFLYSSKSNEGHRHKESRFG